MDLLIEMYAHNYLRISSSEAIIKCPGDMAPQCTRGIDDVDATRIPGPHVCSVKAVKGERPTTLVRLARVTSWGLAT